MFPDMIQTTLRPDLVLWSHTPKRLILVELTVPWEERTEEALERKRGKYHDLAETYTNQGWKHGFSLWRWDVGGFLPSRCEGGLDLWLWA